MKKLLLAAVAIGLFAVGVVRPKLVAQDRADTGSQAKKGAVDPQRTAKRAAMLDAAQRTYVATTAAHDVGVSVSPDELYAWSSRWRGAAIRVADKQQEIVKANQEHVDRMRAVYRGVKALNDEAAKGGEAQKLFATEFYLAEAELML